MKEIITTTLGLLFLIPLLFGFCLAWFFFTTVHKWQRTKIRLRLEQKVKELEADR